MSSSLSRCSVCASDSQSHSQLGRSSRPTPSTLRKAKRQRTPTTTTIVNNMRCCLLRWRLRQLPAACLGCDKPRFLKLPASRVSPCPVLYQCTPHAGERGSCLESGEWIYCQVYAHVQLQLLSVLIERLQSFKLIQRVSEDHQADIQNHHKLHRRRASLCWESELCQQ